MDTHVRKLASLSEVVGNNYRPYEIKETMLCLPASAILKTFWSCFDQSVIVFVFI